MPLYSPLYGIFPENVLTIGKFLNDLKFFILSWKFPNRQPTQCNGWRLELDNMINSTASKYLLCVEEMRSDNCIASQ